MKNAKKMILVEADRLPQINNPKSDLNVKSKPLFYIDEEITKILNSEENINDKLRKYFYALNRFLFFKEQENKNLFKETEIDKLSTFEETKLMQEDESEEKRKKETFEHEKTPKTPKTPKNSNNVLRLQKNSKKKKKKEMILRSPIKTRGVMKKLEDPTSDDDEENFGTPEKTNVGWLSPFKK